MKEVKRLYSLNPEEYPDIDMEFVVVNDTAAALDKIASSEVVYAKKVATVKARRAKVGEVVDTRPRAVVAGKVYTFSETVQTMTQEKVDAGAIIVTNPDGEEYVIKNEEKFFAKYEKCEGGFKAKGGVVPFRMATRDVAISTSWGEKQYVPKGSMLSVADPSDIYSVTNSAFEATYSTDPSIVKADEHTI